MKASGVADPARSTAMIVPSTSRGVIRASQTAARSAFVRHVPRASGGPHTRRWRSGPAGAHTRTTSRSRGGRAADARDQDDVAGDQDRGHALSADTQANVGEGLQGVAQDRLGERRRGLRRRDAGRLSHDSSGDPTARPASPRGRRRDGDGGARPARAAREFQRGASGAGGPRAPIGPGRERGRKARSGAADRAGLCRADGAGRAGTSGARTSASAFGGASTHDGGRGLDGRGQSAERAGLFGPGEQPAGVRRQTLEEPPEIEVLDQGEDETMLERGVERELHEEVFDRRHARDLPLRRHTARPEPFRVDGKKPRARRDAVVKLDRRSPRRDPRSSARGPPASASRKPASRRTRTDAGQSSRARMSTSAMGRSATLS